MDPIPVRSLSRRQFIELTAVAGGLSALAAGTPWLMQVEGAPAAAAGSTRAAPEVTSSIPSICGMCMAQCAIKVDVADGKPVRIRPNTAAPTSAEGICARGVSGMYNTWLNPDSILRPQMRRPLVEWSEGKIDWPTAKARLAAARGTMDDFVDVSWDAALNAVAFQLKELADAGQRDRMAFLFGAWGPTASMRMGVPIARFADTFGASTITFDNPYCTYPRYLGHALTWGHGHQGQVAALDYGKADAILTVRRNIIGSGVVTETWRFMEARKRGAKLVHLSPVFDETASYADVWLPVKPGMDLPILLAFQRYVLDGEHYQADYLRAMTNATMLVKPDGLPLLAGEIDWAAYGAQAPEGVAYVVWDEPSAKPMPDTSTAGAALFGTFRVRTTGGEVEVRTALSILRDQVRANLDALAASHGTTDYLEAAAREADVPVADLRKAAEIVATLRATSPIGWHDPRYSNSPQTWRAVGVLMGLLGRIEAPGGLFLQTHLVMPYGGIFPQVLKYGKKEQPLKTIRGATYGEYANPKNLFVVPIGPPLPGPTERGAPAVHGLHEAWAEEYERENKALYLYDTVQFLGDAKATQPRLLFITGSNPVPQIGNARLVEEAFKRPDLVVLHDVQYSDTAAFADVLLPDIPYLERLDPPLPGPFSPFPMVTLRFPWYYEEYKRKLAAGGTPGALDREFRSRDGRTAFEILLGLGKRLNARGIKPRDDTEWAKNMPLGLLVEGDILPVPNMEKFVNAVLRRLRVVGEDGGPAQVDVGTVYRAGGNLLLEPTGTILPIVDQAWTDALGREVAAKVHLFKASVYSRQREDELWQTIHRDSAVARGKVPLPTPSGKVELYSVNLAVDAGRAFGATLADPADLAVAKGGLDPLFSPVPLYGGMNRPDYLWATGAATADSRLNGLVPPDGKRDLLLVYRHGPFTHTHSATQNNLLLNTLTPDELLMAWIHPDTAAGLGVREGDWLSVRASAPKVAAQLKEAGVGESPSAGFRAHLTTMVRPGLVSIYHNWPVPRGRLRVKAAKLREIRTGSSDDNYLGPMLTSRLGGAGSMGNTVVQVSRMEGKA